MLFVLDRDGVINHDSKHYIKTPDEWKPIPGSLEAIAKLTKAGHKVVVATNQSGVARGLFSLETMHKIHDKMMKAVEAVGGKIDKVYFCPHHPDDHCDCRKPKPGMLDQIRKDYGIAAHEITVIGDSFRDLKAAATANMRKILVKTGNGEETIQTIERLSELADTPIFQDLLAVAEDLV